MFIDWQLVTGLPRMIVRGALAYAELDGLHRRQQFILVQALVIE
jgi:hypothetical protein